MIGYLGLVSVLIFRATCFLIGSRRKTDFCAFFRGSLHFCNKLSQSDVRSLEGRTFLLDIVN